jgi:regulator of cell morphogenesis and NO signaling
MMMHALNATVGRLVAERPGRARLFERLGIDYCRGGGQTLAQACSARGLDPDFVDHELRLCDAGPREAETDDYLPASMGELADFIAATHHAYLRRELPRLAALADGVAGEHAARYPELHALRGLFTGLRDGLEIHLSEQERVVFPLITRLEAGPGRHVRSPVGSVADVVRIMEHDLDEPRAALARLRAMIDGLFPPPNSCRFYRALRGGLAELEVDLRQHVHRERDLLFPAALAAEAARPGAGGNGRRPGERPWSGARPR